LHGTYNIHILTFLFWRLKLKKFCIMPNEKESF
jgi:hypothetical protein